MLYLSVGESWCLAVLLRDRTLRNSSIIPT